MNTYALLPLTRFSSNPTDELDRKIMNDKVNRTKRNVFKVGNAEMKKSGGTQKGKAKDTKTEEA